MSEYIQKGIIQNSLGEVLHNSMIPYAESVIMDRALPRVEDGLKPVQRRILYSMYDLGLTPDKPHKKCARIVGECLGKYHPHGDSSVYEALVRLAQDFNMRMTLVDGHGNFGSIDGDGAAAMRYTEARLQPLAMEMLKDINKNTVDFTLNFDDSLEEPVTLPSRFPNLLVNGTTGIAVGIATNIPTHNLGEVVSGVCEYIDNPKIKLAELMKTIKGPDFPTGGFILLDDELEKAYATGKGKITVRAKILLEKEGEKSLIVIKELPYQVNKQNLLRKIADMREDKKDDILSAISDIADESDRNGMRAVIKLKKDANVEKVLAYLYKNTELQTTFGINMYVIAEGKPQLLGLIDIIKYYVEYQRTVVLRRSKFDLASAEARAHILEGLIIAVKNIDEVIRIIKTADNTTDAKAKLRARFSLSNEQAQAILDLRLARLTKLEVNNLKQELADLKVKIKELKAIIGSKALQMEVVKNEMSDVKRRYKSERRTAIIKDGKEIKIEKMVETEETQNYVLGVSLSKNFKKIPEKNYNMSDKTISEKTTDNDVLVIRKKVSSADTVLAFTNFGNCYKLNLKKLDDTRYKEKGTNFAIAVGCAMGEEVVDFIALNNKTEKQDLLFYTKEGLVKRTNASEYLVNKDCFTAIKLKDGDELFGVEFMRNDTTLCFVTEQGMCLNAGLDDVPVQGRVSGGVKGVKLNDGDRLVYVKQIESAGEVIIATSNNTFKRVISALLEPSVRYRKGVKICDLSGGGKVIFADFVQEPYELIMREQSGVYFSVDTEDVVIEPRTSKGKSLKLHKKANVTDVISAKEL